MPARPFTKPIAQKMRAIFAVSLPLEKAMEIEGLAEHRGITRHALLRIAILDYLDRLNATISDGQQS